MRMTITLFAALAIITLSLETDAAAPISFNQHVRPILSENCFACHGPDAKNREAELRLDTFLGATAKRKGQPAVIPNHPEKSALIARITATDPDEAMPPPGSHKSLSKNEIETLRSWISQGAVYQKHWAFEPISRPQVNQRLWGRQWFKKTHPIDAFVRQGLKGSGLRAAKEATPAELLRRVTLDLTGLPPTIEELDGYLADDSKTAYENVVDRLLASPRYAEHMTRYWLDAARYADTHGYSLDNYRSIWPYRNWVLNAFNDNMPFDQFTIEQLAGDLLPSPTNQQKVATGFNRCNMTNGEGGAIEEEFLVRYAVDRVNTMGAVWLGLTVGCAQCHDHKFDPLSMKEFYQLFAYFNNVAEPANDRNKAEVPPILKVSDLPGKPATMIMQERPKRRPTHMLVRGQYDQKGKLVNPGVPAFLPPLPADGSSGRLALARWLVAPNNPLPARVTVNRFWQQLFGSGIVASADDFGSQGTAPTHPELLDWLASEFIESGWNVKALIKQIVTSNTYRQTAAASPKSWELDPKNRLLTRGPRFRIDAEMLRDQVLAASGLLVHKLGGPSVKPYQPAGIWEAVGYPSSNTLRYKESKGEGLYRRSVYTFWKRIAPPASMQTFDAPSRETCTVRRERTNTPLQALVLMNDPQFVEAARKLAERMIDNGSSISERAAYGYRLCASTRPSTETSAQLQRAYNTFNQAFKAVPADAVSLLKVGRSTSPTTYDPIELASWTMVANTILNLAATVNK